MNNYKNQTIELMKPTIFTWIILFLVELFLVILFVKNDIINNKAYCIIFIAPILLSIVFLYLLYKKYYNNNVNSIRKLKLMLRVLLTICTASGLYINMMNININLIVKNSYDIMIYFSVITFGLSLAILDYFEKESNNNF